jgi:hypothetical protein
MAHLLVVNDASMSGTAGSSITINWLCRNSIYSGEIDTMVSRPNATISSLNSAAKSTELCTDR